MAACCALAFAPAAFARKVALVIANWQYESTSPLANPASDAALVEDALLKAGFDDVRVAENQSARTLMRSLQDFSKLARGADVALVYYAGHGLEAKGRNWLLPVDARLQAESDLPFEAIELDRVLGTLAGAKLRMAMLDACRNNPFANQWTASNRAVTRGLARVEADDVLVIFAAAPGQVAQDGTAGNSPFARSLARRVVQPGLPVQMLGGLVRDDVLSATKGRQRPYISASITGQPLYLVGAPDAKADQAIAAPKLSAVTGSPADRARPVLDKEGTAWAGALKLDTAQGYRSYMEGYPDGAFVTQAQANIDQILDPTANGGDTKKASRLPLAINAMLPDRYAVPAGEPSPIDGVWRISTNKARVRIEGGRVFAVDGWTHLVAFFVKPDQITMKDLIRIGKGRYVGKDGLLLKTARLTVREDGNIAVVSPTFPFPTKYTLVKVALDDPEAFAQEMP